MRTEKNSVFKETPSLIKLAGSLLYESLTIIAIALAGAFVFIAIFGDATTGYRRTLLQTWLWLLIGSYYIFCWRKSGQTLAMQAWRLKLVLREDGANLSQKISYGVLIKRYIWASLGVLCFGIDFLWAIVDKKRVFLHDKWAATKMIVLPKTR